MERDIDLLHFGMGKCMSTSLQAMWRESAQVQYVDTREMSWKLNRVLVDSVQNEKPLPDFDLKLPPVQTATPVVVSNEEFTFSFTTAPNLAPLLPLKQKYLAQQLQGRAKRLLLIVRSPMAWIRSAHSQRIHQGGVESLGEYLEDLGPLVMNMTHLKNILGYWEGAWDRLTVVPMELFIQYPERFWDIYVNEMGLPMPQDLSQMQGRNKTNKAGIEVAAAVNKLLVYMTHLATQHVPTPNHNNLITNAQIVSAMESTRLNGTYLAFNEANGDELDAVKEFLHFEADPQFNQAKLSADMRQHLLDHFVAPLADWPHMKEWIDAYREEVLNS